MVDTIFLPGHNSNFRAYPISVSQKGLRPNRQTPRMDEEKLPTSMALSARHVDLQDMAEIDDSAIDVELRHALIGSDGLDVAR